VGFRGILRGWRVSVASPTYRPFKRVGQFLAVHANLPGKQAIRIQLRFGELVTADVVVTGAEPRTGIDRISRGEKNEMVSRSAGVLEIAL